MEISPFCPKQSFKYSRTIRLSYDRLKWLFYNLHLRPEYIRKQTDSICLAAIGGSSLRPQTILYIRNQTKIICDKSVYYNPWSIGFIKKQSYKLCVAAIEMEPFVLGRIKKQTKKICMKACKQDLGALYYIRNETKKQQITCAQN